MGSIISSEQARLIASQRKPKQRLCANCGKEFITIGRGIYCSDTCRGSAAYNRRKTPALGQMPEGIGMNKAYGVGSLVLPDDEIAGASGFLPTAPALPRKRRSVTEHINQLLDAERLSKKEEEELEQYALTMLRAGLALVKAKRQITEGV